MMSQKMANHTHTCSHQIAVVANQKKIWKIPNHKETQLNGLASSKFPTLTSLPGNKN